MSKKKAYNRHPFRRGVFVVYLGAMLWLLFGRSRGYPEGMPYREMGVFLITVTLDGSKQAIRELGQRLSVLPDVSVKTTFAKL